MADTDMETDLLSYISPGQVGVALKKTAQRTPAPGKTPRGITW